MNKTSITLCCVAVLVLIGFGGSASADVFGSYTCDASFNCNGTVPVTGSSFDLQSNSTTTASGLFLIPTGTLTLSQIVTLSAQYDMTTGSFGGGAPRFSIFDTTSNANNGAYVYWGTPLAGGSFSNPDANNASGTTGNYANLTSPDVRVYVNGFGGQNTPNTGETWSTFVSQLGSTDIGAISLDLDGGFTEAQEMLVSSFTVNNDVDVPSTPVPEPASLALLGSGLVGLSGVFRRRIRR